MPTTQPRWSQQTKLVVTLSLLVIGGWLLLRFAFLLPPLIIALIVAYVLSWPVDTLTRRTRLPRGWATFLVYLLALGLFISVLLLVVPPLVRQVQRLNLDLQQLILQAEQVLGRSYTLAGQTLDGRLVLEQLRQMIQATLEGLLGHSLAVAVDVVSSLVWVVFVLVVSFYLVKDGPLVRAWLEQLPPPAYRRDFQRLQREIGAIWAAFFRGQVTLALVVAAIFVVLGFAIGLPGALPMGLLAGLLEFLPSIGHGIWLTLAALLAFFFGSTWLPLPNWAFAALVIGLHVLFQQFDLNYLIPRIIGRRVHLHPLVVILGIVAGAATAGVLGIALAAPTIASARVLGRYLYARLFDMPMTAERPVAEPLPPPNLQWWQHRICHRNRRERKPRP